MSCRTSIKVFGKLSVEVDGVVVRLRTKPAQALLARLTSEAGIGLQRTRLATDLWPELDYSVSGNRLRTTLVILKKALGPADPIEADRNSICLTLNEVNLDLVQAATSLKKVGLLQDLDEELDSLHDLVSTIDQPFMMGFDDDWIIRIRQIWLDHRSNALLRIAQIQEEFGYLSEALGAINRILVNEPFHALAWSKYLRLMAKSDRSEEALKHFGISQRQVKEEYGTDFDGSVLAVANQLRHGGIQPKGNHHRFSGAERNVLVSALETMATNEPDQFLHFVASSSFAASVFHKPSAAFNLVVDSLERSTPAIDKEVKAKAIRVGIAAAFTLNYIEEREGLCRMLIDDYPESSDHHTMGLAQLSFLKFESRDFEAAYEMGNRALSLAKEHSPANPNSVLEASIAAYDWHTGKFEPAEKVYRELIEKNKDRTDFICCYNFTLMSVNLAFLKSIKREWEECLDLSTQGLNCAIANGFEPIRAAIGPLLGFTMTMVGKRGGARLIIDGLKDCYRFRNTRIVEVGLDYAAGALIQLGDGANGIAILDAVTPLRNERCHPRSFAEDDLANWMRCQAGETAGEPPFTGNETLLDLVMFACEALENHVD